MNSTNNLANDNANKTIELTSDELDKLQQCDYMSLFSHLPISFQLNQHTQQLIYNPHFDLEFQQQATYKLCFASVCILFGCFFAICGYRFLKLSTFIVGFSLGSSIIYLILSEQKQLTLIENLIISLSIGVLFAFVALLVQYIGLFLIGITSSVSVVTCILILIDLFYTNKSAWLCIGLLFVCATLVASITLKFQKSLTIVNTSIIGSALLLIAIDFFVENNLLVDYIYELYRVNGHMFKIYERQNALLKPSSLLLTTLKAVTQSTSVLRSTTSNSFLAATNSNGTAGHDLTSSSSKALALFLRLYSSAHAKLCWYTWLIFSSFFVLLIISLLVQFLITGKNYDHRDSWHKLIRGSRRKKSANLEKIRLKSNLAEAENTRHHHNHHHYTQNDGSSSSSSNLELVPTTSNSNNNNNNIKISKKQSNDTMLLVEESSRSKNYKVTSANEAKGSKISAVASSSNRALTTATATNNNNNEAAQNENFEIISFEVIKPNARKNKSKSKTKPSTNSNKINNSIVKEANSSPSTSTTASTSSSSSTSSTTILLPKLSSSNNTTDSCVTKTSALTNQSLDSATPPMVPQKPTVPPAQAISGSLLPPPVPQNPPPKLTLLKSSLTTSTLNSNTLNSPITSSTLLPLQSGQIPNLAKMKHHRHSVNSKEKESQNSNSTDKFRHFYQVRRNHGDALSQDFINNVQTKLSSNNLNNNLNNTINEATSLSNGQQKSTSLTTSDKKKAKSSKK